MAELVKLAAAHILRPLKDHGIAEQVDQDGPLIFDLGLLEGQEAGILGLYQRDGEELLGSYRHMSSPGRITLFGDTLRRFFWAIIHRMARAGHQFWQEDLEALAYLTALKTWTHEQFHLFVDIQEHLSGGHPTAGKLMEEALASAHSWRQVHLMLGRSPLSRIHQSLRRPFLERLYDYGSLPGYSKWSLYDSDTAFETGLLRFFDRPEYLCLETNGVPVSHLLKAQLDIMTEVRTENRLG